MIRTVEWSSGELLTCAGCLPADVILCVTPALLPQVLDYYEFSTIDATLILVGKTSTCGCNISYKYTFEYDEDDLIAPTPLIASDITGVMCKNCFTTWVADEIMRSTIV